MAPNRVVLVVLVLVLTATALSAAPCAPSDGSLCLSATRFAVSVAWTDFQGNTGSGHAVPLTADTGYFWFFNDSNVELIVKVLDATAINGKFWVFFGALSNVEYTLTVRDTATGSTKTYQNPSGQFASVGDTQAFAADSGSPAVTETVLAQGAPASPGSIPAIQAFIESAVSNASRKAVSDFTPCAGGEDNLLLSNCRFRVEVNWADSQGHNGPGQPVQLSADTGYFWFFSDSNVELMVKVLDARPINGSFWVFFGALSNVEYTVVVTDTISGAVHSYHNPASTFASLGDTSAFRGGYAISVTTDAAQTATGTITSAGGGSLSVSSADGTVFTLTVPPNAIASDQDISMTPVASVAQFPFAGGLVAGVDLQPAGLTLWTGATLSIHTPAAVPPAEETPVAWNGNGEDFFLFPPNPSGGDLALFITHFAGYGVARATDAERTTQLGREPGADDDLLSHQLAPLLREGRAAAIAASSVVAAATTTDWRSLTIEALDARYLLLEVRAGLANTNDIAGCALTTVALIAWGQDADNALGDFETAFPGRRSALKTLITDVVRTALVGIHQQCQQDVTVIDWLPSFVSIVNRLSLFLSDEVTEALGCLSFRLEYQSMMTAKIVQTITESTTARVDITTESPTDQTIGTGSIVSSAGSLNPPEKGCSVTYTPNTGVITARLIWPNFSRGHVGSLHFLSLLYVISDIPSTVLETCSVGQQAFDSWWWDVYTQAHGIGLDPAGHLFRRDGFQFTHSQSPWATAHQPAPADFEGLTESTDFKISHTPH